MNVDERLAKAVQTVKEYKKLQGRLTTTREMLSRERNRYNELKKQLALEGRDVERVDGITLQNLWYTLNGDKSWQNARESRKNIWQPK